MSSGESVDRRKDRPWLIALAVVLAAGLALSPWLAGRWGDWTTSLQDDAAAAVAAGGDPAGASGSGSVLVVVTDDGSVTRSVVLLTRPAGESGLLAIAPAQLFVLLPGFGEFPLGEATVFEDRELTALSFQNAFGIRVDHVLELTTSDLISSLRNPVEVTLSSPLIEDSGEGPELIADAGRRTYRPDVVVSLLTIRGPSEPLVWLERQTAVWEALVGVAANDPSFVNAISGRAGDVDAVEEILGAVASSEPQVALLPVERSAGAGDSDGFTVDTTGLGAFVAGRVAHLALGMEPRPRAEVLNGNGRFQATRPIVEVLVRNGFNVIRTDNAERFDFPETLIISQGNDNRPDAEQAADAIGVGSLQLELTSPSGVVDVSIIVGQDVPAREG